MFVFNQRFCIVLGSPRFIVGSIWTPELAMFSFVCISSRFLEIPIFSSVADVY